MFFDMHFLLEQNEIKSSGITYDGETSVLERQKTCSIGIQTETHPILYAKDYNYVWNAWDKMRKAIKLANLQKCRTISTQTTCQSSFETQTFL